MKLKKTREAVTRWFENGAEKEQIDNTVFELSDENGARMGEITAYNGGWSGNLNGSAKDIADAVSQIEKIFNAKMEE